MTKILSNAQNIFRKQSKNFNYLIWWKNSVIDYDDQKLAIKNFWSPNLLIRKLSNQRFFIVRIGWKHIMPDAFLTP
jgi:hypothetical protein